MSMRKTFKSKIGLAILIPIAFLLMTIEILMIINGIWLSAIIVGLVILFITYLYLDTSYKFTDDNKLKIKSGFLINKSIDIHSIKTVKQTRDPLASPALSLDRLEIYYNKYDKVIISPKEKSEFVNQLKQINANINVE